MDTHMETNAYLTTDSGRAPEKGPMAAHAAIERTAQAAHHAIDWMGPAADRWIGALRSAIMEHPLTAVGIAIFVGFILGRIL